MADGTEEVALRLKEFIEAVPTKATRLPVIDKYRAGIDEARKEPILQVCEGCVGRLTDQERTELHRILKKMAVTVG
jgi:hypothetical protein